ncbi:Hypothetical protein AA314_02245 [Archangium gephyra]|uniref:Uncharacterized protein n=1 Tax=Archangium gephyra TaxID=48 RepID=A0AAC8Q3T1_9BACT|nr:Hypothetical protein AA314_02245 [Archangium gephyra]
MGLDGRGRSVTRALRRTVRKVPPTGATGSLNSHRSRILCHPLRQVIRALLECPRRGQVGFARGVRPGYVRGGPIVPSPARQSAPALPSPVSPT